LRRILTHRQVKTGRERNEFAMNSTAEPNSGKAMRLVSRGLTKFRRALPLSLKNMTLPYEIAREDRVSISVKS
jgi:hypothetical protein